MRISYNAGVGIDGPQTITDVVAEIAGAEDDGFDTAWVPQMPPFAGISPWNALTTLAVAAPAAPHIGVGTSVVVAQTQHPLALANQALTTQAAVGGRLTLGVGLSQQPIIEGIYGYPFERPAHLLREYLSVLLPALRGEAVSFHGDTVSAEGQYQFSGIDAPAVVLAALGPRMLALAGELTDGTVTAWTGPKTIETHIVPRITAAASAAGRATPRIIASLIVGVTDEPDAARAGVAERFGMAASFPSYRAMLDIEGVNGVDELVALGDESTVAAAVGRYADAGATELVILPIGSPTARRRAVDLLTTLPR